MSDAARLMQYLKFRDSLTVMDSRFRGNDRDGGGDGRRGWEGWVSLNHAVIPPNAVIPAEAGIHRLIQGVVNPET